MPIEQALVFQILARGAQPARHAPAARALPKVLGFVGQRRCRKGRRVRQQQRRRRRRMRAAAAWLLLLLLPPHQTTEGFRTELKKAKPVLPCELAAEGNCCCGTKVPPSGCSDGAGIGMARALLHERSVRVVRTTTATATWMRAVRLRRRGLAGARCGPFRREGRPHQRIRSGCSCHRRDRPLCSYRCSRCDNNPS